MLIAFGVVLLIPELGAADAGATLPAGAVRPQDARRRLLDRCRVGGALGFVCAPCAGPILAAVIIVSASTGPTVAVVLIAIAYSIGLSAVMLLYGFGGRAILNRIKRAARGQIVERALGVVLLATGIAMAFNLDIQLREAARPQHAACRRS